MKRNSNALGFKNLLILFVPVAFILFTLPPSVLAATTCSVSDLDPFAGDCAGQFDGNDSVAVLNGLELFGNNDWIFLQKSEAGGGLETNIDVGLSVTTNNGFQSGSWSVTEDLSKPYRALAVVLKGGPAWVAYLYDPPINGGDWTTAGLMNQGGQQPDLSHLSLYAAPVPIPAAVWLLGGGLIGLIGLRRRYKN